MREFHVFYHCIDEILSDGMNNQIHLSVLHIVESNSVETRMFVLAPRLI